MQYLSMAQKSRLEQIPETKIFFDLCMAKVSNWKIGGIAPCIVKPLSESALIAVLCMLSEEKLEMVVVGQTTNLLFSDKDFECVIVQLDLFSTSICEHQGVITCGAGLWVPMLSRYVASKGLTGAEHLCGIPASLGGLIYMNGGSQRKSIGDNVVNIRSWDGKHVVTRDQAECNFSYRFSVFHGNSDIILSADICFPNKGETKSIRREMLSILKSRRLKFPRKVPNCGSVFISNSKYYAAFGPPGKIIEELGLKGLRVGGAKVSMRHGNFIENENGATAIDVLEIIHSVRSSVFLKLGITLTPEVRFVDHKGIISSI